MGCPIFWGTPYYLWNEWSYELQIVCAQAQSEQKPVTNFGKSSHGRSQEIFTAPIYRAHRAVIFAIALLSCYPCGRVASYIPGFSTSQETVRDIGWSKLIVDAVQDGHTRISYLHKSKNEAVNNSLSSLTLESFSWTSTFVLWSRSLSVVISRRTTVFMHKLHNAAILNHREGCRCAVSKITPLLAVTVKFALDNAVSNLCIVVLL